MTYLTYLSFDTFGQRLCKDGFDWDARSRRYPLLRYAAKNCGTHVCLAGLVVEDVRELALKIFRDEKKVATALQAFYARDLISPIYLKAYEHVPAIHLVVRVKCVQCAASWKASYGDINAKFRGRTVLVASTKTMCIETLRSLIDSGAYVNDRSHHGSTALMEAIITKLKASEGNGKSSRCIGRQRSMQSSV